MFSKYQVCTLPCFSETNASMWSQDLTYINYNQGWDWGGGGVGLGSVLLSFFCEGGGGWTAQVVQILTHKYTIIKFCFLTWRLKPITVSDIFCDTIYFDYLAF